MDSGISPDIWRDKPLASLMDYIVQTHHVFCRQESARLVPVFKEVIDKHGKNHPELRRIQALFSKSINDLSMHLVKEEQTLFPYIARVEEAVRQQVPISWPPFGTVENPIRMMVIEHDQTDDELMEMRRLSDGYTPPPDACPNYTALYAALQAFDRDMQEHIHFENDLLFPRAIAMEEAACANRR